MTDRELLEAAARAEGIDVYESTDGTIQNRPILVFSAGGRMGTMPYEIEWNPLRDDDQAFRLAVKLRLEFEWWKNGVSVKREDQPPMPIEYVGDDPCAATRRAVVRAAAEIGRSMT